MAKGEIIASGDSIASILKSYRFEVPFFQRQYSWEKEQIIQFWEDIRDIKQPTESIENVSPYFIGAMVFEIKDEEKVVVIDGQQRLATITILLSVIRDLLFQADNRDEAKCVQDLIAKSDWHKREEYILTLGEIDSYFFEDFIQKYPPTTLEEKKRAWNKIYDGDKKRYSNKLILDAYEIFCDNIKIDLASISTVSELVYLTDLADILTKKLRVVTINVGSDADAFGVFETLNDRGIELSIPDLFKNHIFSVAYNMGESQLSRVRKSWSEITMLVGERGLTRFLRHYWISRYGHVRQRELYNAIKSLTKQNGVSIPSLVQEIRDEAEVYRSLVKPNEIAWREERVLDSLHGLDTLGVKQCYPLLLAAKQSLDNSNFTAICNYVEKLTFRYSTVCRKNPNRLEREYSKAAIILRKGENDAFLDVIKLLSALYPDDHAFRMGFLDVEFSPNKKIAQYILRRIEIGLEDEGEISIKNAKKVHLEHIMPITPNSYWKEIIKKRDINHEKIVKRLGNLTLLDGKRNISLSNSDYDKKRDYYKESKLKITSLIVEYKSWNEESISKRQEWLFERAKEIW